MLSVFHWNEKIVQLVMFLSITREDLLHYDHEKQEGNRCSSLTSIAEHRHATAHTTLPSCRMAAEMVMNERHMVHDLKIVKIILSMIIKNGIPVKTHLCCIMFIWGNNR